MKYIPYIDTNVPVEVTLGAGEEQALVIVLTGNRKERCMIELGGEGARVAVYAVFFGRVHEEQSLSIAVRHVARHTVSHIEIVGALDSHASATVTGTIDMSPGAHGSDGREEIRTLLLSPHARVRAIPELGIGTNDVKCSHAVTTTHIDTEKKFYLESRGMSEEDAVATVVHGHYAGILDHIADEAVRKKVQNILSVRGGLTPDNADT